MRKPLARACGAFYCALVPLLLLAGCAGGPIAGSATPAATTRRAATLAPKPTSPSKLSLDQRIDAYIATLTPAQQIGQTLMLAVYANGYNADLDQALTQWHLGSAIVFPNYNGGPLMPTHARRHAATYHDLQAHADTPLLLATDEEGGRWIASPSTTARRPRRSSSPPLATRTRPIAQAQTDAQRMRALGFNLDFAPLADVSQGQRH